MAAGVTAVLEVTSLEVRRSGRPIVSGISFSASRGEVVALMGASGAGKTTILRAIAGLDPIGAGTIVLDGMTLKPGSLQRGHTLRELHRRVGMVFQFHHLFAHMTAHKNVWLALVHVLQRPLADAEARAQELLISLGVGDRSAALPHELSGGEAQRVAIARAIAVEPPLLLMDEPTASLDPARRQELAATLRQLAAQGRTIVIATHDAEFARACADRVLSIDGGRIRTVS
jgi:polar amino acid transport system ATP-binding protein